MGREFCFVPLSHLFVFAVNVVVVVVSCYSSLIVNVCHM